MRFKTAAVLIVLAVVACGAAACERVQAESDLARRADRSLSASITPAEGEGGTDTSASALLDGSDTEPTDVEPGPQGIAIDPLAAFPTVSQPRPWTARFGGVVNGVRTRRKVVALTFDDGPTVRTHELVDELAAAGMHATFFWVGSRITTDDAEYALAHGDELANHTWSHPNMRHLTSEEASSEIGMTSARIAQVTGGYVPVWFRSPYNRLYPRELAQVEAHGLAYANYDVTSVDWMPGMSEADVVGKISENLRPGGVILMHDSPDRELTYIPAVLKLLEARGYKVVTMSHLALMGSPRRMKPRLGVEGLRY